MKKDEKETKLVVHEDVLKKISISISREESGSIQTVITAFEEMVKELKKHQKNGYVMENEFFKSVTISANGSETFLVCHVKGSF